MADQSHKRLALGFGSFVGPHESTRFARERFIQVAQSLYPGISADLQEMGVARINDWARKWNLNEPWILELARFNLDIREPELSAGAMFEDDNFHLIFPDPEQAALWKSGSFVAGTFPPENYDLGEPDICRLEMDWNPLYTTDDGFREHLLVDARRQIEAHITKRGAAARAAGFVERQEAWTIEHFTWLAEYQCGGREYKEIAAALYEDAEQLLEVTKRRRPNYIRDAVRELSDFIGIGRRKARRRPGRPPGSKSIRSPETHRSRQ